MKWLVISSHDERYDFNLNLKIFKGNLEEFEELEGLNVEEKKELNNGIIEYHIESRHNNNCPSPFLSELWNNIKENLEVVTFETVLLIPFENLNNEDFFLEHPIVNRNIKFGFLDIKINK